MADIEWPLSLSPYAVTFYLSHSTRVHESPYSRARQTLGLAPSRWMARISIKGGGDDWQRADFKGAQIDALLAQIRGPQRSVSLFDFRRPTGRGDVTTGADYAATLTPTAFTDGSTFTDGDRFIVTGSTPMHGTMSAGSVSVVISGFAPNRLVRGAGDYIGFGVESCFMCTADVASDASGNVTVFFEPPLRRDVPMGAPVLSRVRAKFRLMSDDAGSNPTDMSGFSMHELDFVEDLT